MTACEGGHGLGERKREALELMELCHEIINLKNTENESPGRKEIL